MFTFSSFIWKTFPRCFVPHFPVLPSSSLSSRNKTSHQRCSIGKAVLKNFATFTGRHLCRSPFLMKLQAWRPTILLRDSITGVFLWILWNFKEHYFWRTSTNGSYCRHFYYVSFIVSWFYVWCCMYNMYNIYDNNVIC